MSISVIELPTKHSSKVQARVLGIDPAISRVGWSILDYKPGSSPAPIDIVRWGNITPGSESKKVAHRDECNKFTQRVVALDILRSEIKQLIEEYSPTHIVIEDAFYNPKFPNAYATLVQCITVVTLLARDLFGMPVYTVPTRSAKKSINEASGGASNKVDVLNAILASPVFNFKQKKRIGELDHHSSDSIAVAYHFISEILHTLTGE